MGAMGVILGLRLRGVFFVEVGAMGVYFGITVDRGWARGAIGWIEVGEFVDFCLLFNLWTFGSLSGFWRVARVRGVYRNALHFDPRFECVGLVFSPFGRGAMGFYFGITVEGGWARGAIACFRE